MLRMKSFPRQYQPLNFGRVENPLKAIHIKGLLMVTTPENVALVEQVVFSDHDLCTDCY